MELSPSEEQEAIITDIGNDLNILGDCVAGSGKTTTVLFAATKFPKRRFLQITYNSQLKLEVREKVKKQYVKNLEIHTYHSLCVKYYHENGRDDAVMRRVVERNMPPKIPIPVFDTIIIDETQDMKDLFYNLVVKFIDDMKNPPANMLILGDRYQAIYKFMGADSRFLTLTPQIWKAKSFENRILSTSYRLTNEIAAFVNDVMLGYKRIQTERSGSPVIYIRDNIFTVYKKLASYIIALIDSKSIKPEDIFVLAASIAGESSPIRKLENELVNNNIPCYYPTSDERKLDEDIIDGKVIFSTFHQAKGRERKVVIVYGFDDSYYKFFGRDYSPLICPETLYVACTRAKEKLVLVEGGGAKSDTRPLPFLKMTHNQISSLPYVDFAGISLGNYELGMYKKDTVLDDFHTTTPTDLIKFLKEHITQSLIPIMGELFIVEKDTQYNADIPSKIKFDSGLYEEVSDINGIVIPAMYEARQKGESTVQKTVKDYYLILSQKKEHTFLQAGFNKYMNQPCETIAENLYLVTLYISMNEKLYHKIKQIKHYNWLTQEHIEKCWNTLGVYLHDKDTLYEQEIETICDKYPVYGTIEIKGRFDALTDDTIWEIKCVDILTIEHFLQVIVYAWMWRCIYFEKLGSRKVKIINIRTGEVCALKTESHLIDEVMMLLFENKYGKETVLSDSEFIERCAKGIIDKGGVDSAAHRTENKCILIDD